jgi:hypothetical protein
MQSCIVIQTLLYPPIYINENSIDEHGFKSQNILVLSESDGAEDDDSALALLDAIEEDFHRGSMGKRYKIKGRRELQNLKSSINYDVASVHSRSRRGKAQVL